MFALVELTALAGSFILLPFAVSAFLASLLGFYDAPVEIQWGVFVFGGGLLFVARTSGCVDSRGTTCCHPVSERTGSSA